MSIAFDPIRINGLKLENRFVRSATAERLADMATGAPLPPLTDLYATLARALERIRAAAYAPLTALCQLDAPPRISVLFGPVAGRCGPLGPHRTLR